MASILVTAYLTHQFGQRHQVRKSKQGLGIGKMSVGIFPCQRRATGW